MGHNRQSDNSVTQPISNTPIQLSDKTSGQIKFLSLNVCGLRSKLRVPEFLEHLNLYDVIGLQETKLGDVDCISIPDDSAATQNRLKISRYRSSGTAFNVRYTLLSHITFGKSNSKLIQWLTIDEKSSSLWS